jgi:hypothetical protein
MNEAADIVSGPNLLERYGCGPIRFSSRQDALYERHRRPKALDLALQGKAAALMRGGRHMDELMCAVVVRETGIGTARGISHCFVMDVAGQGFTDLHGYHGKHRPRASPTGVPEFNALIEPVTEGTGPASGRHRGGGCRLCTPGGPGGLVQ